MSVYADEVVNITKTGIYYVIGVYPYNDIYTDDGVLIVSKTRAFDTDNYHWVKISSSNHGIAIKRNTNAWIHYPCK